MADLKSKKVFVEKGELLGTLYDADAITMKGVKIINQFPAADVVPVKRGRWERVVLSKNAAKWSSKVSCSICHHEGYTRYNYCPNCGAMMEGETTLKNEKEAKEE